MGGGERETEREIEKKNTSHKHSQYIPQTGRAKVLVYLPLTTKYTKYILRVCLKNEVVVKMTNGGCKPGGWGIRKSEAKTKDQEALSFVSLMTGW